VHYLTHCPSCESKSFRVLYDSAFQGSASEAVPFFMYNRQAVTHGRICKCRTCGMAFTNPQFPPEEYSRIYLSASKRGPTTEKAVVSDATRFRKLSRIVLKYSPAKGRLLDFGCGSGQFLHTLTNHEYVGFDLTTLGEHSAFNSRVLTGEFLDMLGRAPLDYQSFDIITAWDVIEHLPYLTEYTEVGPGPPRISPTWTSKGRYGYWPIYMPLISPGTGSSSSPRLSTGSGLEYASG
jgi:hypothetical protein